MRVSRLRAFTIILVSAISFYLSLPTLAPSLISWIPDSFKSGAVNLGLDLKGGASLLLEVEIDNYMKDFAQQNLDASIFNLKKHGVHHSDAIAHSQGFDIIFQTTNETTLDEYINIIRSAIGPNFDIYTENNTLKISFYSTVLRTIEKNLLMQSIEIIRRRVDETGAKEIDIQRQGTNYILLQVPGSDNPEDIKRLLGKTAKLSFHIAADGVTKENLMKSSTRASLKVLPMYEENIDGAKQYLVINARPLLTGDMLMDAQVSFSNGTPGISFKLNNLGSKLFGDASTHNIGKPIAIVLDEKVLSAPVIREPILGGTGFISGSFSVASANELALLLRAGALPAPLKVIEERVVGPSLGVDSIEAGTKSVIIGVILVVAFMILFYGAFGAVANIALIVNLFMIIACLSLFGATLTLPGIAGIVLTLGMAVDANVLICERIREELRNGKTNLSAIESGYHMAFHTILDANITTIIASLILYIMGSSSIKSFALSLMIGIICSMFTAVSLTKLVTDFWYSIRQPKKLCI